VDKDCEFKPASKIRGGKDPEEAVYQIVNDLIDGDVSQNMQEGKDIQDLNILMGIF
jgi:hypothetical protein